MLTIHKGLKSLQGHISVVLLAFAVVYFCSLTFVYVEGDDASTIAYHVLGRDASIQPPYSAYHGMMDRLLSVFPANESLLRIVGISVSSAAAVAFVILMLSLAFDMLGERSASRKGILALIILLAIPEFFYLGLIYMPAVVAMSFVLASHLLIRRQMKAVSGLFTKRSTAILLSLLLFALGASFRWDVALYGFVITTDLALQRPVATAPVFNWRRALLAISWGCLAVATALTVIWVSGYGLSELTREVLSMSSLVESRVSVSWFTTFGGYQSLFTPALVMLGVIGFVTLSRKNLSLIMVASVGVLSAFPMLKGGVPKMIITAIPGVVLCAAYGFMWLSSAKEFPKFRTYCKITASVLLVMPWIVGVKIYSSDTAWGPGFEVASYRHTDHPEDLVQGSVDSRKLSIRRFGLTLGGGMAIPTPEGPRALGGHAAVLLAGGWPSLVTQLDHERREVVAQALAHHHPILQDSRNAQIIILLAQMGFNTADGKTRMIAEGIGERRFFNNQGEMQSIVFLNGRSYLYDPTRVNDLVHSTSSDTFVLYSSYSSAVRRISDSVPQAVRPLGPFSAIVDTRHLSQGPREVANYRIGQ